MHTIESQHQIYKKATQLYYLLPVSFSLLDLTYYTCVDLLLHLLIKKIKNQNPYFSNLLNQERML